MLRKLTLLLLGFAAVATAHAQRPAQPNFVIIYADDLGWQDVKVYDNLATNVVNGFGGTNVFETPYIDALASEGVLFTQAYSPAPTCSPSRSGMMSGRHPGRVDNTHVVGGVVPKPGGINSQMMEPYYSARLELEEVTIAEALKPEGYYSGHIGKWHMSVNHGAFPHAVHQGFDFSHEVRGVSSTSMLTNRALGTFATTNAADPFQLQDIDGNPSTNGWARDIMMESAFDFLGEATTTHSNKPFFCYYASWLVHAPIHMHTERVLKKYAEKMGLGYPLTGAEFFNEGQENPYYAAMVERFDYNLHRIMHYLENTDDPRWPAHKLIENTYVFFMSDNGGAEGADPSGFVTDNFPLDLGKSSVEEGGTRVPCIILGPDVKTNVVTDVMMNGLDIYPTIMNLAGVTVTQTLDGVDLTALLTGDPTDPNLVTNETGEVRDTMFWHFPHGNYSSTIRIEDWKLIKRYNSVWNGGAPYELYRMYTNGMSIDLTETNDLYNAPAHMSVQTQLIAELENWLVDVDASYPHLNPKRPATDLPNQAQVPAVLGQGHSNGVAWVAWETNKAEVATVEMIYTLNGDGTGTEEWFDLPVAITTETGYAEAVIPDGTTHFVFTLVDSNNFLVHSVDVGTGSAKDSTKVPRYVREPTGDAFLVQAGTQFPTSEVFIASPNGTVANVKIKDDDILLSTFAEGESFTTIVPTELTRLTLKVAEDMTYGSGDNRMALWIGNYDASTLIPSVATEDTRVFEWVDFAETSITNGSYITIDFSDVVVPAGTYAFQLAWPTNGADHYANFYRGFNSYAGGRRLAKSVSPGTSIFLPFTGSFSPADRDLEFVLHGAQQITTVVYEVTAPWSSETVNLLDDVIIRSNTTVTLDQDSAAVSLTINDGAATTSILDIAANTLEISGSIDLGTGAGPGFVNLSGGTLSHDFGDGGGGSFTLDGAGEIRVHGGALAISNGLDETDEIFLRTNVEVTNGTVILDGEVNPDPTEPREFTVVGDAATIDVLALNQGVSQANMTWSFVFGPSGVSPINVLNGMSLVGAGLTVDGSAYAGGPGEFVLFAAGDFTGAIGDSSRITVSGFAPGLNASVVQEVGGCECVKLVLAPAAVWDGGGADDNWTNDLNWSDDVAPVSGETNILQFAGSVRTTPNNDFTNGSHFGSIHFNPGADPFTLVGNPFDIFSLIRNDSTSLQAISNDVTLGAGTTLNAANGNLALGGMITNNGFALTVVGAETTTISGALSGGGKLNKRTGGALVLASSNTYSGGTSLGQLDTVEGGTTILMDSHALGSGGVTFERHATIELGVDGLEVGNYIFVPNWRGSVRTIRLDLPGSNSGMLSGNGDIRFTAGNGFVQDVGEDDTLTLSGVFNTGAGGGGAGITKDGAGTLILSGANTYGANTTAREGLLQIGDGVSTNAGVAGAVVLAGGGLAYNYGAAKFDVNGRISLNTDATIGKVNGAEQMSFDPATGPLNGGGFTLTVSNDTAAGTASLYFNQTAGTGFGQVNVVHGSAGEDLTGGQPLQGAPIDISNGAQFRTSGSGTNSNDFTLNGGAGPDGLGALSSEGSGAATYAGAITLAGDSGIGGAGGGSITFAGEVDGSGSLTKIGANAVTLSGSNTYSGTTTVEAGTLVVGTGLDSGGIAVEGGTLLVNTSLDTYDIPVSGPGTLGGTGSVRHVDLYGTISPGTSPGTLVLDSLTLQTNSVYTWEITNASGVAGVDWDLIVVGEGDGDVTNAATVAGPHEIRLVSPGTLPGFDTRETNSWKIIDAGNWFDAGGAPIAPPDAGGITIDASNFANFTETATFSVTNEGGDLILYHVPGGEAASWEWDAGAYPDRGWSNPTNWTGDTEPGGVVTYVNGGHTAVVTESESIMQLHVGRSSAPFTGGNPTGTVEQSGGYMNVWHVQMTLGENAGDKGVYRQTGGRLRVWRRLAVGNQGLGQLFISGVSTTFTDDGGNGFMSVPSGSNNQNDNLVRVDGGLLDLSGTLSIGTPANSRGTVELGSGRIEFGGDQSIGSGAGSHGTLVVTGGSYRAPGRLFIGGGGSSTGTVMVSGGVLQDDWFISVGHGGQGEMYISGVSTVEVTGAGDWVQVSRFNSNTHQTNRIVMNGGSLLATNSGSYIGVGGEGAPARFDVYGGNVEAGSLSVNSIDSAMTQTGGTVTVGGGFSIGTGSNHNSEVTISGGALTTGGGLSLGSSAGDGEGILHVMGGLPDITIGDSTNENFTVNASGELRVTLVDSAIAPVKVQDTITLNPGSTLTVSNTGPVADGTYFIAESLNSNAVTTTFETTNWLGGVTGTVSYTDNRVAINFGPPPPAQYAVWAAGFGLAGDDANPTNDFEGDTYYNLTEYGHGGDPTNAVDGDVYPKFTRLPDGDLEVVYRRRSDAEERGLTYIVERAVDPVPVSAWSTSQCVEVASAPIDADFESVTNELAAGGVVLGRVRITLEE